MIIEMGMLISAIEEFTGEEDGDNFFVSLADNGRDFEIKACRDTMDTDDISIAVGSLGLQIDHLEQVTDEHPQLGCEEMAEWDRFYVTVKEEE